MLLGPPYMNRKITRLALPGKCDSCGASGLVAVRSDGAAAWAWRAKNPS